MTAYMTLPQIFSKPGGKNNHLFDHNANSKASIEKMGFYLPDLESWEVNQSTQTFWVFEGSTVHPEQISLQANPELHDPGSTLYHLLVIKWSLSIAWGTH